MIKTKAPKEGLWERDRDKRGKCSRAWRKDPRARSCCLNTLYAAGLSQMNCPHLSRALPWQSGTDEAL